MPKIADFNSELRMQNSQLKVGDNKTPKNGYSISKSNHPPAIGQEDEVNIIQNKNF